MVTLKGAALYAALLLVTAHTTCKLKLLLRAFIFAYLSFTVFFFSFLHFFCTFQSRLRIFPHWTIVFFLLLFYICFVLFCSSCEFPPQRKNRVEFFCFFLRGKQLLCFSVSQDAVSQWPIQLGWGLQLWPRRLADWPVFACLVDCHRGSSSFHRKLPLYNMHDACSHSSGKATSTSSLPLTHWA